MGVEGRLARLLCAPGPLQEEGLVSSANPEAYSFLFTPTGGSREQQTRRLLGFHSPEELTFLFYFLVL